MACKIKQNQNGEMLINPLVALNVLNGSGQQAYIAARQTSFNHPIAFHITTYDKLPANSHNLTHHGFE